MEQDRQEERWIRAIIRRGSRRAADALVRKYYDEIYRFVYRQVGDKEDAMDITQESFISALQSLPSYAPEKAGFRTWLYRIAARRIVDQRRRYVPPAVPAEELELIAVEDFTSEVLNRELLEKIGSYINELDPEIQEVFRLRVYGSYRFPEIASALGQPEAKIKAQYYRLVSRLRKEFKEDG